MRRVWRDTAVSDAYDAIMMPGGPRLHKERLRVDPERS